MKNLDTFLATINTPIAREKARAVMEKRYNFEDMGIATIAEWIAEQVETHGADKCRLVFQGTTTKKRAGCRFEGKPKWAMMTPDNGTDIGKIGARFAQSLGVAPDLDIDAHEKAYLANWEKENGAKARHKAMYGW